MPRNALPDRIAPTPTASTPISLTPREAWIAPAYFGVYLASLFASLESDLVHWLTLVLVPLALAAAFAPPGRQTVTAVLASFGLSRGNLTRGMGWALLLGAAITLLQVLLLGRRAEIQELILSGRALWLFPLTFLLMLVLAGFTEEFFFRGFLQTRVERLVGSKWLAVPAVSLLFGVYHLPYAYLNPMWPSAGNWGAAWAAAMGNGVPGGVVLGALYVVCRRNLLPCIVLHSLINAAPAMTMLRLSGG